jgi:hypothetical protein
MDEKESCNPHQGGDGHTMATLKKNTINKFMAKLVQDSLLLARYP